MKAAVNKIYQQLVYLCPDDLVQYQDCKISKAEQVKVASSLLLSSYINHNWPAALDKHKQQIIFQLFFTNAIQKFREFSQQEIPQTINLWLSRLYLSDKSHRFYLMIEDKGQQFTVDIEIALAESSSPIKLKQVLSGKNTQAILNVLSDLACLTEYLPDLEQAIDNNQSLSFAINNFTEVFLNVLPVLQALGITIILPKSLRNILRPKLSLDLSAKEIISDDRASFLNLETLLQFDWKIAIGDKTISVAAFKKLLKDSRGLIKIMDNYVLLDEKEMEALLKKIDKLPEQLSQADLMQAALAGELMTAQVNCDEQLMQLLKRFNDYQIVTMPHNLKANLRPYQIRGFSWLVQNIEIGFGSILADDMGLGKTLQVITAILYFKNIGQLVNNKVLIVAPTSLLSNWQKEIERFAPALKLSWSRTRINPW